MTRTIEELIPDYIRGLPVYVPGRPIEEVERELKIHAVKLASNENPLGPSPMAVKAMQRALSESNRYPDGGTHLLRATLAERTGVSTEEIFVGLGSSELIDLAARVLLRAGLQGLTSYGTYAPFSVAIRASGAELVLVPQRHFAFDLKAMVKAITPTTGVIYLANPNNPTGTWLSLEELRGLRARLRSDILLVVDEAYFDYVQIPGYGTALALVDGPAANVIVTRTFSKFYGLAGLRVGWAYVPANFVRVFGKLRGPFAVSRVAIAAAIASLGDTAYQTSAYLHNAEWRAWLQKQIRELGYRTTDSVGNFVLFQVPGGAEDALALNAKLAARGLLCRVANQNALSNWIRVSVGPADAMTAFVQVLSDLS